MTDDGTVYRTAYSTTHPVVVIDPEDREQVNRFANAFCEARWSHMPGSNECDNLTHSAMRDALRSLIESPKPEEPTGLGAVVEDVDGNRWVRVNSVHWDGESSPYNRQTYGEINVVKVLSEGIQS